MRQRRRGTKMKKSESMPNSAEVKVLQDCVTEEQNSCESLHIDKVEKTDMYKVSQSILRDIEIGSSHINEHLVDSCMHVENSIIVNQFSSLPIPIGIEEINGPEETLGEIAVDDALYLRNEQTPIYDSADIDGKLKLYAERNLQIRNKLQNSKISQLELADEETFENVMQNLSPIEIGSVFSQGSQEITNQTFQIKELETSSVTVDQKVDYQKSVEVNGRKRSNDALEFQKTNRTCQGNKIDELKKKFDQREDSVYSSFKSNNPIGKNSVETRINEEKEDDLEELNAFIQNTDYSKETPSLDRINISITSKVSVKELASKIERMNENTNQFEILEFKPFSKPNTTTPSKPLGPKLTIEEEKALINEASKNIVDVLGFDEILNEFRGNELAYGDIAGYEQSLSKETLKFVGNNECQVDKHQKKLFISDEDPYNQKIREADLQFVDKFKVVEKISPVHVRKMRNQRKYTIGNNVDCDSENDSSDYSTRDFSSGLTKSALTLKDSTTPYRVMDLTEQDALNISFMVSQKPHKEEESPTETAIKKHSNYTYLNSTIVDMAKKERTLIPDEQIQVTYWIKDEVKIKRGIFSRLKSLFCCQRE